MKSPSKKLVAFLLPLCLYSCMPIENKDPIINPYQGISITANVGADSTSSETVNAIWGEISMCVSQYIQTPQFDLRFVALKRVYNPNYEYRATEFDIVTGDITVNIYAPTGYDKDIVLSSLRHEFVHVALYYYGVKGHGNIDHQSVKFTECVFKPVV